MSFCTRWAQRTLPLATPRLSVVQSDASVGTDEEEGKDWDELEAEARRSDKLREEEDGEGDSSRKRKGGGGRAPPAKKRR
jgi:hypothetical protein